MSVDHTTKSPKEIERIRVLGGTVEWGRIDGLPMTRGLGNFCLEADGFSCMPDVTCLPRAEVEFVVIASDGVWDVLSDAECCAIIRSWSGPGITQKIADEARRLGSSDDIAVVVAYFPQQNVESGQAIVPRSLQPLLAPFVDVCGPRSPERQQRCTLQFV